jgi:Family of unknown function (DUF6263)
MNFRFIFPCFLLLSFKAVQSQSVNSKLKFDQSQVFNIELDIKTTIAQQAMGQSIDFNVDAIAVHSFKVTNATEDNTTLHHLVNKISFSFDGMGQKMKFDSEKEKDMNGQFGKSIKDLLEKKYDIIIDTGGTVLMAMPENVKIEDKDSRMAIVTSMLKDVMDLVQPPRKGNPCFFKFLPDKLTAKGESWTITSDLNGVKKQGSYKLSDINDSTFIVDFVENSVTISKATMMGSETTTTMNNKSTGKITLDRITGIIKEKSSSTESNGTTVGAFGNVPVTSKTTATIKVSQ